jgi:hypothetical protein
MALYLVFTKNLLNTVYYVPCVYTHWANLNAFTTKHAFVNVLGYFLMIAATQEQDIPSQAETGKLTGTARSSTGTTADTGIYSRLHHLKLPVNIPGQRIKINLPVAAYGISKIFSHQFLTLEIPLYQELQHEPH